MRYAIVAAFIAGAVAAPAADNEWEKWTSTTTTTKSAEWTTWKPTTTPAAEWVPVVPEVKKCSTTSVYTTKECGANKDAWDNCKDVTKTTTVTLEKCPETWAPAPEPTAWVPVVPEVKKCTTVSVYVTKELDTAAGWNNYKDVTKTTTITLDKCPETWSAVEVKKCSTTSVYTTKECGSKTDAWDNCKDVTKTTTVILEKCPAETWAPVTSVKAVETTWAPASVPAKASSTVWAPVAKYTGAANKESFGMGALAIAAVAAML